MSESGERGQGPDRSAALAQYRRRAGVYDLEMALLEPVREKAISRLALKQWRNATLLCVPVETADIAAPADSALFQFTHDVMLRPDADPD